MLSHQSAQVTGEQRRYIPPFPAHALSWPSKGIPSSLAPSYTVCQCAPDTQPGQQSQVQPHNASEGPGLFTPRRGVSTVWAKPGRATCSLLLGAAINTTQLVLCVVLVSASGSMHPNCLVSARQCDSRTVWTLKATPYHLGTSPLRQLTHIPWMLSQRGPQNVWMLQRMRA